MKKKLLVLFLIGIALIPMRGFCKEEDSYQTLNLKEVLKDEGINNNLKNYKEDNKQITIYMFRGKGCTYCRAFLTYLNSIVGEYGKYFKLESYEVWNDSKNAELMDKVSSFMDKQAQGVPYIIIGDKVFTGYSSAYDQEIKTAIKKLYKEKNRYDVFKEMDKEEKKGKYSSIAGYGLVGLEFVLTVIAFVVLTLNFNKKNNILLEKINKLEKEIKKIENLSKTDTSDKETKKTVKKVVKKETKKKKEEDK